MPSYFPTGGLQAGGRHRRPDSPDGSLSNLAVTPVRHPGATAEAPATRARRNIPVLTPNSPHSWVTTGIRLCLRSTGIALLAFVAVVLLALTSTTQSVYSLAAATYILPGVLNYPFIHQVDIALATPYVAYASSATPPPPIVKDNLTLPPPPGGSDGIETGSVIFGYSQGAVTATTYKQSFTQFWANDAASAPVITVVLTGNPERPNGGASARANVGATPTQTAAADSGDITTYDIARQYDPVADYPTNPLNLFGFANAAMGFLLVHMDYLSVDMKDAVLQGTFGDTTYYLIPTYPLPLLMPLKLIPLAGPVLADVLDPPLRVLVEAAYDRTINPGAPTPANLAYFPDPTALHDNFVLALSTGWDNGLEDLGMGRPLGTVRPDTSGQDAYGIGGPPVTLEPTTNSQGQLTIMAGPNQSPGAPSQPSNDTDRFVAGPSDSAQQESLTPPPDPSTQPAATSPTKTSVLTDLTTDANRKTAHPNIRGPIDSNPPDQTGRRPLNNGLVKESLAGLTSRLQPKAIKPSGRASVTPDDTSQRDQHSSGAE